MILSVALSAVLGTSEVSLQHPPGGRMLPFRPQLQGVPLPGTMGPVASALGTEDKVQEAPEEGNRLCTLEHDKEERNWVVQRPRRGHIPILWSREGGTAGDHPKAALSGESCPGGGWGLVGLEEGSF